MNMMKNSARIALVAVALVQCLVMASAATHNVGGPTGWTIPSNISFYSDWASTQTFATGDTLVFTFNAGVHDVVEVPKSSYDSCSTANQIGSTITTSPANIPLNASGDRYFLCAFSGHCSLGQKVTISVASAAAAPPTPAAAPPTPAAAPPTPAATTAPPPPPTTPTTTAPPPPPTTTAPPPPTTPTGPTASPTGFVPGAAASLTSRIAALSAVMLSAASYFLL